MSKPLTRPRIVAHRGASHDAPENTLAAFRKAWELDVEAIELDVHVTADGKVAVIHDRSTKRTAGVDRLVAEQTLAELKTLDAGSWKDPAFAGERIPSLTEVLATVPAGRTVFVEIKLGSPKIVADAILAADPRKRGGKLALQGFDPVRLKELSDALPGVPAYWTVDPPLDDKDRPIPYPIKLIDQTVGRGFAGIALQHTQVTDEFLAAALHANILVDVWTINETPGLEEWAKREVRWIETDRPDLAPRR